MRILLIGATGTIGRAVATALSSRHTVIPAGRTSPEAPVDLADATSIRALLARIGTVDAIISAAGSASFKPFDALTDADYAFSLAHKLMGQVNLVRLGLGAVTDGGSITLTGGILAQEPMRGAAAISLVNAGLEGFVRGAALEAPRGIRVNLVSPPWVEETLRALGQPTNQGLPASVVAEAYVASVEGRATGTVLVPEREPAMPSPWG